MKEGRRERGSEVRWREEGEEDKKDIVSCGTRMQC